MMWVRRLVLAAFVVVILVGGWTLAQRNAALVNVDGIFYHVEGARLWLVLVCTFAARGSMPCQTVSVDHTSSRFRISWSLS